MSATSELATYRAVLATRARTFRLAARALPSASRDAAAALYAFCRAADDAADEAADTATAHRQLDALEQGLAGVEGPPEALAVHRLHREQGLSLAAAHDLVAGVRSDLGEVRIPDDAGLDRYAYLVAGTVGVMMCPLLGVRDPMALRHAADLGRAMQITNICRDVAEDAARGRVYLPADRLSAAGIDPNALLAGSFDRDALRQVISSLLQRADALYRSGDRGLPFLPARTRLAVLIASRVYRAIGLELLRRGGDPFAGRAVVPLRAKLFWCFAALLSWLASLFRTRAVRPLGPDCSRVA